MPCLNLLTFLALAPSLLIHPLAASAHEGEHTGAHAQSPLDPNETDWATRHMQSEHHISNFDARSFFTLHDYDSDGYWEHSEIRRTYGLENEDSYTDDYDGHDAGSDHVRKFAQNLRKNVSEDEKERVAAKIMELYDEDGDGVIEMDEWVRGIEAGKRLPDFGHGPGHHFDDEYEYEIHHFERFHNENSPAEEFTHPEDIRHFERHDSRHRDEHSQAVLDKLPIIEANIPSKFLKA